MQTTVDQPTTEPLDPAKFLQDRVPERLRLSRRAVGLASVVGGIFWFYSFQPLYHTDLWGHLAYGRWIALNRALPATEPFMPLAEGMPLVDSVWLAQLTGYLAFSKWGPAAIQFLHAGVIALSLALLCANVVRKTNRSGAALLAISAFWALNWFQFEIVRPQMGGLACCAVLLALLAGRRWRPWMWFAVPALVAAWANLHGSFVVGLALLGSTAVGRAVDLLWRTRRLASIGRDRPFRRLACLTGLAAMAVLVNPWGPYLYPEVIAFSNNSNLPDLIEWDALSFRTLQGQIAAAIALALAFAYRASPRVVSAREVLPLVLFGGLALWSARMLVWWTPLAAGALAWHAGAIRWRTTPAARGASPRSGRWSVVACGLAWIAFAFTPFGLRVLHGRSLPLEKSVSRETPLAAVEYLGEHLSPGLVFNTYEWGDYLLWASQGKIPLFLTSHAHLVPREVWRDYLGIINVQGDWSDRLDQYGVETILVDKRERRALIAQLKEHDGWRLLYEDGIATIFVRKARDGASQPRALLQTDQNVLAQKRSAPRLDLSRSVPLRAQPLYDDPALVSDAELDRVLEALVPRFAPEHLKPNLVEHALRLWGVDATFADPAAWSGALLKDFLVDHGRYLASWGDSMPPLLDEETGGVGIRWGREEGASVHHDHALASLTEAGVSLDEPVFTPRRHTRTLRNLLLQALADFRLDEREVEWSAMAFGLWLPPQREWVAADGRLVSFDLLARRLMRGDMRFGVCSGTHRLYSLALLLQLDGQYSLLEEGTRQAAYAHLGAARDRLVESQFEDGHWPSIWEAGELARTRPIDDPLHKQVISTGHHLEWLAIAPEELHPPRESIRRAARWAIDTTLARTSHEIGEHYTFYSHVASALALWRGTRPADRLRAKNP